MNIPASKQVVAFTSIGLLYFLAGKFGFLLEIQPNPVIDLRPTAGIALAVILVFGIRSWPVLLTGAFIIHFCLSLDIPRFTLPSHAVALSACLALADTLQAVVGAYAVQRLIGRKLGLSNYRDIMVFLLIGGPVCCAISALWVTTSLSHIGPLAETGWHLSWLAWWSGNIIGFAIFTPLMLCLFSSSRLFWSQRRRSLVITLCCTLVLIALSNSYVRWQEQRQYTLDFNQRALRTSNAIETTLVRYLDVLRSLGSLYSSSEAVSREKFRQFTAPVLDQLDGIQALSWNPLVKNEQRASMVATTRAEGIDGFQFTQRDSSGTLSPADARDEYVVVHYIEPYAGNESALGFDVASNPVRKRTLVAARDSGKLLATAKINLVQEMGSQAGVLVFLPVYTAGKVPETLLGRQLALRGFVVGVFRLGDVLASNLKDIAPTNTVVQLQDNTQQGPAVHLAAFSIDSKGSGELVDNVNDTAHKPTSNWSSSKQVAGRHWQIVIQPNAEILSKQQSAIAVFLTLAGPLIASLVSAFLLLVTGRNAKLTVSNELLEREISERKHAETRLFKEKRKAEITLNSIGDAVITTGTNDTIKSLNPIAEELTGWSSAAASGQPLHRVYQTTANASIALNDLLATGISSNAFLTHCNGKVYSIFETRTPIKDHSGKIHGSVVVFRDVTEQDRLTSRISYQASHDALTGLINRHEFERRLEGSLKSARTHGFNHTLCYLDLDAFKTINDTSGHRAGDELLQQITALFKTRVRHGDALGRLGGDEFGLVLEHCDLEQAESICEALRKSVENYSFKWEGKAFRIGVSIGLASVNRNSSAIADLLALADNACYSAKNNGKNQVATAVETEMAVSQQSVPL